MNHFERVAIFTVIENMENQLRGLKTMIAASAGTQETQHKVTKTIGAESQDLSEEDENKLEEALEQARSLEIGRMQKAAESHYQKEFEHVLSRMSD